MNVLAGSSWYEFLNVFSKQALPYFLVSCQEYSDIERLFILSRKGWDVLQQMVGRRLLLFLVRILLFTILILSTLSPRISLLSTSSLGRSRWVRVVAFSSVLTLLPESWNCSRVSVLVDIVALFRQLELQFMIDYCTQESLILLRVLIPPTGLSNGLKLTVLFWFLKILWCVSGAGAV